MALLQPRLESQTDLISYKLDGRTSLLDLPYEIRIGILIQYFQPTFIYLQTPRGIFPCHSRRNPLVVLATCRQIRNEARAILDKQIVFKTRCLGDLMRYTKRDPKRSANFLGELKRLELLLFDIHDSPYRRDWRQWDPQSTSFTNVFRKLRELTVCFRKDAGRKAKPPGEEEPFIREVVRGIFDPCRRNIKKLAHGSGNVVVILNIEFCHLDKVDTRAVITNGMAEVTNSDAHERYLWKKYLENALEIEKGHQGPTVDLEKVLCGHQK